MPIYNFKCDIISNHLYRHIVFLWTLGGRYFSQLECGPMPNLMVTLPNTGGALCSTPQSLADVHY